MTITPEELKDALQELRKQSEYPATRYDYARVLRKHIDAQAARITELDAALRASSELQTIHREDKKAAVKELAALRNDVSTWETMRKANGLPDTIGATILLAASLRQEMAALQTDNEMLVAVNSELANELEVLREQKNQPLPKNLDNALTVMGVSLPIPESELELESARWVQRLIDRVIRVGDKLSPAPVAVPDDLIAVASRLVQRYIANKNTDSEFICCVTPERRSVGTGGVWDDWKLLDRLLRLNSGSKPECTRCRDGWRPDEMGMVTCDCDKGKAISLSLASGKGGTVSDD